MAAAQDARAHLTRLITGHILSSSIYVVAKLGVVDAMAADRPTPIEEIATRVGADVDSLYRVLRTLASEGLFIEVAPRAFRPTETGELLRDGDLSPRYMALMHGEITMPTFTRMIETVRTGTPVTALDNGKSRWDMLAEDPEQSETFNKAMRGRAPFRSGPLRLLDWSGVEVVVDVGGGTGGILLPLLVREPALRGILFDLDQVATEARAAIEAAGVGDRCTFESGSFFEDVPTGGDVYLLSNVLHDWNDIDAARILAATRAAFPATARLVVLESLLQPSDVGPDPAQILDLQMLVGIGGRERTEAEYRALFEQAGFVLERIVGEGAVALEARPL